MRTLSRGAHSRCSWRCRSASAAAARAQGPVYSATPPTPGALYSDGQTGRYLLGGSWLYRPDPSDVGVAQGWWGNVASTDGWSPVTVPNAYNAGDFSSASMSGYVGWYRRDFTLPSRRVRALRARRATGTGSSASSRSTTAPRCGSTAALIGAHTGAYLPFEFDLTRRCAPGVNRLIVRVDDRRGAVRPAAGAGRRMVELRRDPARGLPARGADAPTSRRCRCGRSSAARAARPTIQEQALGPQRDRRRRRGSR